MWRIWRQNSPSAISERADRALTALEAAISSFPAGPQVALPLGQDCPALCFICVHDMDCGASWVSGRSRLAQMALVAFRVQEAGLQDSLDQMRSKFKTIVSLLGLQQEYLPRTATKATVLESSF